MPIRFPESRAFPYPLLLPSPPHAAGGACRSAGSPGDKELARSRCQASLSLSRLLLRAGLLARSGGWLRSSMAYRKSLIWLLKRSHDRFLQARVALRRQWKYMRNWQSKRGSAANQDSSSATSISAIGRKTCMRMTAAIATMPEICNILMQQLPAKKNCHKHPERLALVALRRVWPPPAWP